jgi:D-aminopeptidase
VLLTSTLSVFRVADALLGYLRERPAFAQSPSLNPVVAETNDGYLSDIWARALSPAHVAAALDSAAAGPVAEGCVGAGTGTRALGFKAGIGTSSRVVPAAAGGPATVGALVQSNFGGLLTVCGVPVAPPRPEPPSAGNSCVIVLATDARLDSRTLWRLGNRAFAGMARAGSDFSGRSGDYALAIGAAGSGAPAVPDKDLDALFTAAIEATEEAILNSLCMAVTTTGYQGHVSEAVPLELISGTRGSRCGS